ncbi:hypothetical protein J056_004415 [Wallemia ichthyophaga EXF-994]|uniref:Uncharacterized protein n=1 Tax=Wallemia ichthyophaga (strain EXF-994 / CBS 113033) TaxID=1299270 RepID=R9AFU7_WALI9|nr:uncharacterized protein J056_004415 [Wallemia ichthyophaga EXF-994]EOR01094.1 hypothetical protein J056_004415 [Wallemia ichthyophaga EXF-994]TIB30673.1 hypothetical protein E3P84_03256 [Wallemia ichthyophaga]TIB39994.1 hypothetical protein E3P83_03199 [Wallemia ichthyophaga]
MGLISVPRNGIFNVQSNGQASTSRNVIDESQTAPQLQLQQKEEQQLQQQPQQQPQVQTPSRANDTSNHRRDILSMTTQKIPDELNAANIKRLQITIEKGIIPIVQDSVLPIIKRYVHKHGENYHSQGNTLFTEIFTIVNDLITPMIQSTMEKVSAQHITQLVSNSINTTISTCYLDNIDSNGVDFLHNTHKMRHQNQLNQQSAINAQNNGLQSTWLSSTRSTPSKQDQRKRTRRSNENDEQIADANSKQNDNDEVHFLSHSKNTSPISQEVLKSLSDFRNHLEKNIRSNIDIVKQQELHTSKLKELEHVSRTLNIRTSATQEWRSQTQTCIERLSRNELSIKNASRAFDNMTARMDAMNLQLTQVDQRQSTLRRTDSNQAQGDTENFKISAIENLLEKMGERITSIENTKVAIGGTKLQSAAESRSSTPQQQEKGLEDRLMKKISSLEEKVKEKIIEIRRDASQQQEDLHKNLLEMVQAKLKEHFAGIDESNSGFQDKLQSLRDELKESIFETFEIQRENSSKQERRIADLEIALNKSYEQSW